MKLHLKRSFVCAGAVVILMVVGTAVGRQSVADTVCNFLGQALTDSRHIKAGTSKSEVEKYFEPDGGVQFPPKIRYVHKKCSYLHVDVQFDKKNVSSQPSSSPDATVTAVSKLYIDYPTKD